MRLRPGPAVILVAGAVFAIAACGGSTDRGGPDGFFIPETSHLDLSAGDKAQPDPAVADTPPPDPTGDAGGEPGGDPGPADADEAAAGDVGDAVPDDVPDLPPDVPIGPLDPDKDGVPGDADLWPDDPSLPGVTTMGFVYAHSSETLYSLDAGALKLTKIGDFQFPNDGGGHEMTDIAIDEWGVLYGVTFDRLYTCHPATLACHDLGELPEQFNGLTMIPAPAILPAADALVGISNAGGWYHLQVSGGKVNAKKLGDYGGWKSSGDAFSVAGMGTFATVDDGLWDDSLIRVDPKTGKFQNKVATFAGYSEVYGLAGWGTQVFAFDSSGSVLRVDLATGKVFTVPVAANESWWGAGVRTRM